MKKRSRYILIISVCLCTVIITGLFIAPARASDVYFTAVNNTILDLKHETMPVNLNGTIYVYYKDFGAKDAGGSGLGTYVYYSTSGNIVQIIKGDKELRFDLGSGSTYDQDGNTYTYRAIFRKGNIFLPVNETCSFFGLSYSFLVSRLGVIIRIKSGDDVLNDYDFTNSKLADDRMQTLYNQYLREQAAAVTPSAAPTFVIPPTPTQPVYSNVEVFLALYGLSAKQGRAALDALGEYNYKACFFVTDTQIKENAALIREILGTGHNIGLLSENGSADDYIKASQYLRSAAGTKAILAASLNAPDESELQSIGDMGLLLWFDESSAASYGDGSFRESDIYASLRNAVSRADIILELDEESGRILPEILESLKEGGYKVKRILETEAPAGVSESRETSTEVG